SITELDWDALVLKSELPVMVTFTAEWCIPCGVILIPKLNEMDSQYKNKFKFYTVNADQERSIASRYDINHLPTTFVFKYGEAMTKVIGPDLNKLEELVKEYM
ncbi:hypothetical protein CARUB_v10011137mg, partial [Capsella rubella]